MRRMVALQNRDFRLLWFGRIPSIIGSQMHVIAINWHVFDLLRGSERVVEIFGRNLTLDGQALGLGSLGLARIGPVILFALLGGIIADTRDRRHIMLWSQLVLVLSTGVLAFLTLNNTITLPLLFLLTAIERATFAFEEPAGQSIVPNLVPKHHLANAVSLNTILFYLGTVIGPGIGGWLIAQYDVGLVYLVNSLSFGTVIVALLLMRYRGQPDPNTRFEWAAVKEGIRYTHGNKLIWSTMLLDFWATFFASARTMLPIVADRVLGMGVEGYGLLATAQPVGAVLTGTFLALRTQIRKQGIVLLVSVAIYGLATALFGLSTVFGLSYVLFALTGSADTISSVIRGTIRQLTTPDELRGRMTSINMIFFMGGPQLGEVEAGAVAALFGAPFAIVTGGLATIAITAWLAWQYPMLRRYDS